MALATFSCLNPLLSRTERVHLQGWGEPFQNPHFFAMAQMARRAGCSENVGSSLFVAADGAVSPCVFVGVPTGMSDAGRRVFGNVCLQSPLEIWQVADYQIFRHRLAEGEGDPVCQSCPKRFSPAKR